MADYNGEAIVNRCCDLISGRVRFDEDLSSTDLVDLACAIVFVNAFWSGPSLSALRDLTEIIYEVDPTGSVALVVCDIDRVSDLANTDWALQTTGGIGEMAWICDGRIVARHHTSHVCDVRVTTCSLIAECCA
jgi:hypothetical protein